MICFSHQQQNLVNSNGYPFEDHEVVSEDGYILTLHRIPRGRHEVKPFKSKKPVALFQHGLLASSDVFLFRGPEHDLRKFKLQSYSKSFIQKTTCSVYNGRRWLWRMVVQHERQHLLKQTPNFRLWKRPGVLEILVSSPSL